MRGSWGRWVVAFNRGWVQREGMGLGAGNGNGIWVELGYKRYTLCAKETEAYGSNPKRSQESTDRKNDQQRLRRAKKPAREKDELSAEKKFQRLERKIAERELTTIPIQYDNELNKFCTRIETDLITDTSNTVHFVPGTTAVSELRASSAPSSSIEDQECLLYDVSIGYMPIIRPTVTNLKYPAIPTEPYVLPDVQSCDKCGAKRFLFETLTFCCSKGEVMLYPITVSENLVQLYTGSAATTAHFMQYIRAYNNAFAFTSCDVNLDPACTTERKGIYTFRAQGQMYHAIRGLNPTDGHPAFLQLYFYDTAKEVEHRLHEKSKLRPSIISDLIEILKPNPYSQFFRNLTEVPNLQEHQIRLKADPNMDNNNATPPTVSQVAAIWIEDSDAEELRERDIIVQQQGGHSQTVRYYYGCYDPLQYPLLFPLGEPGWHRGIKRRKGNHGNKYCLGQGKVIPTHATNATQLLNTEETVYEEDAKNTTTVSAREYYAYRLQIRASVNSILLQTGRLLQQYVVDMYVKIETSRLDYFKNHQREIRADLYQGIVDTVNKGETQASNIGTRIILPGSFLGGPRDMRKRYLDAMALVGKYGKPDLFLTMTCNPNWKEIKQELKKGEEAQNRPDLLTRIFRSKFQELRKDVIKKELFGPVAAYTFVIEFQKRGLPHVHMLLILENKYKLVSIEQFDGIISAELPDKEAYPHLHAMVVKHMMHGPCGTLNKTNVCMQNGSCKINIQRNIAQKQW
ncbi:hypothetical protein RHGRI_031361 [Rhododendron griersonianum]|uniref:Helitron helicase-like domain-containing protein n=1 Tax=Rhododendron griersonianum TaxID=479676 RepID=A0AAV6I7W8_9ERIC|nr:hypothetical protein RHGRI_031361 [Rhododendron griersonianum]